MTRFLYRLPLFLFLLITFQIAYAGNSDNAIAELSASSLKEKITAGDTLFINVKVTLQKGWHINSNQPEEDFLIPTKLTVKTDSTISTCQIIYPAAEKIQSDLTEKPLMVFNSGAVIKCSLIIPPAFKEKKLTVNFELEYQACNNKTCSAPETAALEKTFILE